MLSSNQGYASPPEMGDPEIIAVTNPAAGANWSQTVPTNTIWLLLGVRSTFTTDVTVATRLYQIQINDGTNTIVIGSPHQSQTASLARNINFWNGGNADTALALADYFGNLVPRLYLLQGWILSAFTSNIQAGDAHTAIKLYVHRWLTQ